MQNVCVDIQKAVSCIVLVPCERSTPETVIIKEIATEWLFFGSAKSLEPVVMHYHHSRNGVTARLFARRFNELGYVVMIQTMSVRIQR